MCGITDTFSYQLINCDDILLLWHGYKVVFFTGTAVTILDTDT